MNYVNAKEYVERLYPELDTSMKTIIAIAYMDGCIDTLNKQTKEMEMNRLIREEREEKNRLNALDIQEEMYDEEEYTREDEAYDRASSNKGELI